MDLDKILKFLNFKLFFFISICLSLIGFIVVLSDIFILEGFLELINIELEFLDRIPNSFFFMPLIFWNIPLFIVIIARIIYRKSY